MTLSTLEANANNETSTSRSLFWALEPKLPLLAAKAAVEFDWIIQGNKKKDDGHKAIDQLLEILASSIGSAHYEEGNKAFTDQFGTSLFTKAYNQSHKLQPVKSRDNLDTAIKDVIISLKKAQKGDNVESEALENMRAFCVALSDYSSGYRKAVYGSKPQNPYRK